MNFPVRANLVGKAVSPAQSKRSDPIITECFSCGRSMVYRGPKADGTSGRFCSEPCRQWFDAGNPAHEPLDSRKLYIAPQKAVAGPHPGYLPAPMRMGPHGFFIICAGCGNTFESRGLAYCKPECSRAHRERQENAKLMAEAGMEPAAKRSCLECGAVIPAWRNGRRTRADVQFCKPSHRRKYARRNAIIEDNGGESGPGTRTDVLTAII